ncbi:Zinc finger and SCAN domain-containing protein 5B [Astathelohania contejeani]|uniref:Zinc finger and SCAN domain-containing protein 5B n=1 Tax=Astathelohania contejeani TaxID=164912 RepID=A0ABQ7HWX7_9MICR|nr:Zinc finger and SCAN domain-containing protein 5B [Thelohania contejeani]
MKNKNIKKIFIGGGKTRRLKKPFCFNCRKSFMCLEELNIHMKIHVDEKAHQITTYMCLKCKKRFSHWETLKIHRRIHTGEKPYTCVFCENQFDSPVIMRIHQKNYH